jgi:aspartyl-tRNA synthetase
LEQADGVCGYNSRTFKSSVDKFYSADEIKKWFEHCGGQQGDLLLILAGEKNKSRKAMSELRLEMGERLGLRKKDMFKVLWVYDFPLLEWNGETMVAIHLLLHHRTKMMIYEKIPVMFVQTLMTW